MKLNKRILVLLAIPAAMGLLVAGAYVGFFLYEMMASSVGRGGGPYALQLPAVHPQDVKKAEFCDQKTAKWIGCF